MNPQELQRRKDEQILEDAQEAEADINVPWIYHLYWTRIAHYYGDYVRQIFIVAAIIMLLAAPFYTDNLSIELPFIVAGAILLIFVAALTSPQKQNIISADAVASGVGFVIFEMWALLNYQTVPVYTFVLRQVLAILFLLAFYLSTKTLRSMVMHTIGVRDSQHDLYMEKGTLDEVERRQPHWKEEAREILREVNNKEKYEDD